MFWTEMQTCEDEGKQAFAEKQKIHWENKQNPQLARNMQERLTDTDRKDQREDSAMYTQKDNQGKWTQLGKTGADNQDNEKAGKVKVNANHYRQVQLPK